MQYPLNLLVPESPFTAIMLGHYLLPGDGFARLLKVLYAR